VISRLTGDCFHDDVLDTRTLAGADDHRAAVDSTERAFTHPARHVTRDAGKISISATNRVEINSAIELVKTLKACYGQPSQIQQVCIQPRPLAVNMALPAFAAERRAAAPCYRSSVACDRAVSKQFLRYCNGTDRRTDRRTPDSCIHPAPHTMRLRAVSTTASRRVTV